MVPCVVIDGLYHIKVVKSLSLFGVFIRCGITGLLWPYINVRIEVAFSPCHSARMRAIIGHENKGAHPPVFVRKNFCREIRAL